MLFGTCSNGLTVVDGGEVVEDGNDIVNGDCFVLEDVCVLCCEETECVIVVCVGDFVFTSSVVGVVNMASVLIKLLSNVVSNCDDLDDLVLCVFIALLDVSVNDVICVASVLVIPVVLLSTGNSVTSRAMSFDAEKIE